jgi:hypothetical protein
VNETDNHYHLFAYFSEFDSELGDMAVACWNFLHDQFPGTKTGAVSLVAGEVTAEAVKEFIAHCQDNPDHPAMEDMRLWLRGWVRFYSELLKEAEG